MLMYGIIEYMFFKNFSDEVSFRTNDFGGLGPFVSKIQENMESRQITEGLIVMLQNRFPNVFRGVQ
jgi:hypothetical protein